MSPSPERPFLVGVLGDSITYGAGVGRAASWPRVLEALLQESFGRNSVRVVSGAVRASSADFAALCWNEIWGDEWRGEDGGAPPLNLAIIDYSFTSSPHQLAALIDRCLGANIPVLATVYCAHSDWHVAWQSHVAQQRGAWQPPSTIPTQLMERGGGHAGLRMTKVDFAARRYLSNGGAERTRAQDQLAEAIRLSLKNTSSFGTRALWLSLAAHRASEQQAAASKAAVADDEIGEEIARLSAVLDGLPPALRGAIGSLYSNVLSLLSEGPPPLPTAEATIDGKPTAHSTTTTTLSLDALIAHGKRGQHAATSDGSAGQRTQLLAARAAVFATMLHRLLFGRRKGVRQAGGPRGIFIAGGWLENATLSLLGRPPPLRASVAEWQAALSVTDAAQCVRARHAAYIRVLARRGVPYVTNAAALALSARLAMYDDRHPSAVGHLMIAAALKDLMLQSAARRDDRNGGGSGCGALHVRAAVIPTTSLSHRCLQLPLPRPPGSSRPIRAGREAAGAHGAAQATGTASEAANLGSSSGQICRLGLGLNASLVRPSVGFRFVQPLHHRTAGLAATRSGAECVLRCSSRSLRAGFLSLTLERGHRNIGQAEISCLPPCQCQHTIFDSHAVQRYTFSQRSQPRWATFDADGICDVRVRVLGLSAGHIMVRHIMHPACAMPFHAIPCHSMASRVRDGFQRCDARMPAYHSSIPARASTLSRRTVPSRAPSAVRRSML